MGIAVGLVFSLIGGTILGLSMYAWDRYQERRHADNLAKIQKES